jgi:hypothetical protein
MLEQLINSPFVFVLGILVVTVAVPVLSHYWYALRKAEVDASLKREMIQRGMSAEEIATVLEAPARRGARRGYAERV